MSASRWSDATVGHTSPFRAVARPRRRRCLRLPCSMPCPSARCSQRCDARLAAAWWHWFFLDQREKPAEQPISADRMPGTPRDAPQLARRRQPRGLPGRDPDPPQCVPCARTTAPGSATTAPRRRRPGRRTARSLPRARTLERPGRPGRPIRRSGLAVWQPLGERPARRAPSTAGITWPRRRRRRWPPIFAGSWPPDRRSSCRDDDRRRDRRGHDGLVDRLLPHPARPATGAARPGGNCRRPVGRLRRRCASTTPTRPSSTWPSGAASSWPRCASEQARIRASSTPATSLSPAASGRRTFATRTRRCARGASRSSCATSIACASSSRAWIAPTSSSAPTSRRSATASRSSSPTASPWRPSEEAPRSGSAVRSRGFVPMAPAGSCGPRTGRRSRPRPVWWPAGRGRTSSCARWEAWCRWP